MRGTEWSSNGLVLNPFPPLPASSLLKFQRKSPLYKEHLKLVPSHLPYKYRSILITKVYVSRDHATACEK